MSPRRKTSPPPDDPPSGLERLQKVLAAAGIGSRRECEELITGGRVEVDGEFVTELGRKVDAAVQKIQVDGVVLTQPKRVYFALNKPVGVVSTNSDPDGRPRVIDLIKSNERLYPVGRLDRTSEGLILVTNDGELANRLTHPRYGVEKVYRVRVVGKPAPEDLAKLRKGVHLSDGLARVSSIQTKRRFKQSTELEIVLQEGLNREIRRILARIGHKVVQLKRVAIGPVRLGTMPVGAHRMLSRDEVQALRRATKRRKKPAETSPAGKGRQGRPSATSGPTKVARATQSAGQSAASDQPKVIGGGGDEAPKGRRKSGSSALQGYSRPSKKGVKRKKSSSTFRPASKQEETSGSARPTARPKKKTGKKKSATKSSRPSQPVTDRNTKKPRQPKKAIGKGAAGKGGAGKGGAGPGQKKSGRKRRR